MTLSSGSDTQFTSATDIFEESSSNWDPLYCSHLWSNSNLRREILSVTNPNGKIIKYCYTCRGKIRKYELKSPINNFQPNNHSTPTRNTTQDNEQIIATFDENCLTDNNRPVILSSHLQSAKDGETLNVESDQCIPSISRQIDSSFRQKYTYYEVEPNQTNQRRLRKSLKGIGCIVNFSLTDSPIKKRTQIQACSISVMIVAIVVISFVLVNLTSPNLTRASDALSSTTVVPTENINLKISSSANVEPVSVTQTQVYLNDITETTLTTTDPTTTTSTTESISLYSEVMEKLRKNIRTYPKEFKKTHGNPKPKEINNRDLSQKFCKCQNDEICMLDENTGTSICRKAKDTEDPTGCGGLCALETEACHLVDRARGVRICRLLTVVTCSPEEWRCGNGLCVSASARCDGSIQCYDRSDETQCECDLTKQFRCGHSISCFPNTKLCDGVIDCWDGYDEVNCTAECPNTQFSCSDGQCILPTRICDGYADCADGSDEPQGCEGACGSYEMRCRNQRCVPRAARCDGRDHCGDGTDELNCS